MNCSFFQNILKQLIDTSLNYISLINNDIIINFNREEERSHGPGCPGGLQNTGQVGRATPQARDCNRKKGRHFLPVYVP